MANTKITTNVIADDAITSAKIADDAITSALIADDAITSALIADDAVGADQLASNAVVTASIVDDAVTGAKIENAVTIATSVTSPLVDGQNFKVNGGQGSDGQVLTSTGSGVAWEDAAGGVAGISSSADATAITIGSDEGVTFAAGITSTQPNAFGTCSFNEADLTDVGTIFADQYLGDADTNTGMVLPGSDVLTLHTGGSERMRFHASGCVGILTTADRSLGTNVSTLVMSGSAGSGFWLSTGNSSATSSKIITSNNGSVGELLINQGSGVNGGSILFSINDSEKMRINSNGKVGIGTTDASNAKLVIDGTVGGASDHPMIDFDGFGSRVEGATQSITFRMGRTGQATDQGAQLRSIFQGGGATAGQTHIGFEFNCIRENTQEVRARFSGVARRIQFNTDEIPNSNNPVTDAAIVIGNSSSTAITSGLTNATVLLNRAGELYAVDHDHNNTQITPHNWGLISSGPSEELAWTYYSQRPNPSNNEQLQTINVDMAKVIRKVEDLVGEKLIYTENSDKDGHTFQTIISDIQTTLADLKSRVETLEG